MPVVNVELSLDRARFGFDRHVGKMVNQGCDSNSTGLAGRAK